MDDLEITKLCAEAMGLFFGVSKSDPNPDNLYVSVSAFAGPWMFYDPLHDDAQAMALVKKFHILLYWNDQASEPRWEAEIGNVMGFGNPDGKVDPQEGLNRAICECVAKMQKEKRAP